jgi:2-methylcitrate synthase
MGNIEPEAEKYSDKSKKYNQYEVGNRLIAVFGPALLYWHHFHNSNKTEIETVTLKTDSIARNFVK